MNAKRGYFQVFYLRVATKYGFMNQDATKLMVPLLFMYV